MSIYQSNTFRKDIHTGIYIIYIIQYIYRERQRITGSYMYIYTCVYIYIYMCIYVWQWGWWISWQKWNEMKLLTSEIFVPDALEAEKVLRNILFDKNFQRIWHKRLRWYWWLRSHNEKRPNISFGQIERYKRRTLVSFSRAPTHQSFTFNSQLLYELKHKVHLSKILCVGFSIFDCLVFIKVYIFKA